MNRKFPLWCGVIITIIPSYLIAWLAFIFDGVDPIKWGTVLSNGTTFASSLSVPVVLAIWSHNKDNDDTYQKDTDIYIEYVEKILKDWDKFRETYNENNIANDVKVLLNNLTQYIRLCLSKLSYRSVYREKLQELLQQTESYVDNFENTNPQEIIDFVPKIIKILAKFRDYIKNDKIK